MDRAEMSKRLTAEEIGQLRADIAAAHANGNPAMWVPLEYLRRIADHLSFRLVRRGFNQLEWGVWLCLTLLLCILAFAAGAWTMGFFLTSGVN